MDKYPISASSLEKFYYVDGHQLERQYKDHLSDYLEWAISEIGLHAENWLVFPANIGPRLSIDETSLSDGELYTIVTNKDAHGRKGALVAIIFGTKSEDVIAALTTMPEEVRNAVAEITLDLSSSMRKIARLSFPKAMQVIDRFHVQKLALEALQEMRIDFRWDAIHEENKLMTEYRVALKRGEDVEPNLLYMPMEIPGSSFWPEAGICCSSHGRSGQSPRKQEQRYSLICTRTLKPPMNLLTNSDASTRRPRRKPLHTRNSHSGIVTLKKPDTTLSKS